MEELKTRYDLTSIMNSQTPDEYGVEIGVHKGLFSRHILETSKLKKLFLVDPWESFRGMDGDEVLDECKRNLSGFEDRYEIVRMRSPEASSMFDDDSLKLVYIDGDHTYRGCMRDICAWWPKAARFCLFAGHDYCKRHDYGVVEAVDDFFSIKCKVHVTTDDGKWPTWWTVK